MSAAASVDFSATASLYPYEPSRAAASIFYVLLGLSTCMHLLQLWRFKSWRIAGFLSWAGTLYTAGFITRMISSYHTSDLGLFIATVLLIFIAPPIYAAVNYLILGRMLHYVPYLSPLHPGRVVTTFIALDVLVEILTGNGASRITQFDNPQEQKLGTHLIRASLILLLALYFCFIALQIWFHRRCIRANVVNPKLHGIMIILYCSNALITIRNIYRVVDTFLGFGYTQKHEWCIYVFDATPMLLNSLMLNFFYPSIFLPKGNKVYLTQDGKTEREGPGWQDKRHFLVTFLDPFDIVGIVKGTDNKTRYWENDEAWPMVTPGQNGTVSASSAATRSHRTLVDKIADPLNNEGRLRGASERKATGATA